MTILAQQSAFGVPFPRFEAMMNIVLDKLVKFGVQFGLLLTFGVIWTPVWKLHEALKGHTNSFAPVVTGHTGLMGNARIDNAVSYHFGLSRRLDRMNHGVSGLVAFDCLVAALIQTGIVVRDVTGRTSHAAEVSPSIPAFNADVTSLAISTKVRIDGCFRFLF